MENLYNYLLNISYKGTNYLGWQFQKGFENTIENVLSLKMKVLLKCDVFLNVAGRTDKGVHANEQCVSFFLKNEIDCENFVLKLNAILNKEDIVVNYCKLMNLNFHARHSCKMKEYRYFFALKKQLFFTTCWVIKRFDLNFANQAASFFVGNHDFSSFRASDCQAKSPIRTIEEFFFEEIENGLICAKIKARSFLHNQIRIMVGTIVQLFLKNRSAFEIKEILQAKKRVCALQTAPANGLFLHKIHY